MDISQIIKHRNYEVPDNLYPSQKEALDRLYDWWHSDEKECTLEGFAGTGKTFLLRAFMQHIVNKSTCITAPTHKALKVIESSIGIKGKTLHSLHGLRPNLELANFDIERPQFDPRGNASIKYHSLVIIDEASMISKSIFALNRSRAFEYNTKILYVGDSFQLPPVRESISKTFTEVENKITLTDIVRQEADNPLINILNIIRDDIANVSSNFIKYIIDNPSEVSDKNTGYELVKTVEFKERVLNHFKSDTFSNNINSLRIATYTNKSVTEWNSLIRNTIIPDCKEVLHFNDLLTSYTTIVDEFNAVIITNSEDYIVDDIRPHVNDIGMSVYATRLKTIEGKVTPIFMLLNHNDMNSVRKFKAVLQGLYDKAMQGANKGWINYYRFRNNILTLIDITLDNGIKISKSLDYGYAMTTHKLQGSTLTNIAVDLTNIYSTFKSNRSAITDRNKLLYVALSRAKNKVFMKY